MPKRIRKPPDPTRCQDCKDPVNGSAYWISPNGRRMKLPRCPKCHEQAVRLATRNDVYGASPMSVRRRGGVKEAV